jgi:hypothetical protein
MRVRFPGVKARVLEDMPADERADLYGRAAELAHLSAAGDKDTVDLLLVSKPLGAPWVIPLLRRDVCLGGHPMGLDCEDAPHIALVGTPFLPGTDTIAPDRTYGRCDHSFSRVNLTVVDGCASSYLLSSK